MVTLYRPTGHERIEFYPKKASTAFAFSEIVYINSSGFLDVASATSSPGLLGLCYKKVSSTDSDYASTTKIPVLVADRGTVFLADIGTGTGAQTNVGEFKDLADSKNIDVTADTFGHVFVCEFLSTTQAFIKFAVKGGPAAG